MCLRRSRGMTEGVMWPVWWASEVPALEAGTPALPPRAPPADTRGQPENTDDQHAERQPTDKRTTRKGLMPVPADPQPFRLRARIIAAALALSWAGTGERFPR